MQKKLLFFLSVSGLLLPSLSRAFCPICTIAVGAGLGLSRWLGVDDLISGIWIGGLIVSSIGWFLKWLDKKNIRFMFRRLLIIASFYLLIIVPLYWAGIMGHPYNKIWGIDRLLAGIILGSLIFLIAEWSNNLLKKRNGGKVLFPFQGVVLPVSFLLAVSLIIYLILKYAP